MGSSFYRRFVQYYNECTWPLRTLDAFIWPLCTLDVLSLGTSYCTVDVLCMGSFSCRRFVFALKDCTWPLRTADVFNWPFCTVDVFNLAVFVLLTYCGRLHHDFGRLFVLQMCVLGGLSEWMFITSQRLGSNVFNLETIQQFKMLRQFLITYQYKVLFLLLINKYTVYIFALYSSLE